MNKGKKTVAWILIMIVTATMSTKTMKNPTTTTATTTITEKHITTTTTTTTMTTTSGKSSGEPETITSTTTTEELTNITTVKESTSTTTTEVLTTTTPTTLISLRPTTTTIRPTTTTSTTLISPRPTTTTTRRRTARKPSKAGPLYLTRLLNRNRTKCARSRARVTHADLSGRSYAGYFTVDEVFRFQLFFWYFPAKMNPESAPVVLYLEGELEENAAFSIFVKNGPLSMNSRGQLVEREDSWHKYHNMLYIDILAGSGYSFSSGRNVYSPLDHIGPNVAEAVQQFFKMFPDLQRNDFFVAGEFFAAPLVAIIANKIHKDYVNLEESRRINLKGIAIGNGVIAPKRQFVFSDIFYNIGLVDSNQRKKFKTEESRIRTLLERRNFTLACLALDSTVLFQYNSLFRNVTGYSWQYNFHDTRRPANYNSGFIKWVNRTDVRNALHVGNNVFHPRNHEVRNFLIAGILQFKEDLFIDLLNHYRVLIYTGNLDIVCPYSSIRNGFNHIPRGTEFGNAERKQWRDRCNSLAGYIKKSGNLVEVLVRNAGHFTSIDQPRQTRELLEDFTHGRL